MRNSAINILLFYCITCPCFGKLYNGFGIQMAIEGAGLYYKQLWSLTDNSQFLADIGLHTVNHQSHIDMFAYNKKNKEIILDCSTGYRHELYKEQLVGLFRPILIFGIGGMSDLSSISTKNMYEMCMIKYMLGLGVYFYNRNIINELSLQLINSNAIKGNVAFQLAMYWK